MLSPHTNPGTPGTGDGTMYAHYTQASKARSATVMISKDIQGREFVCKATVHGKRGAREFAKEYNAQPWNF